ncbi:MAG: hypothetical protein WAW39_30150 [Prosthecobacter sp.]|uniref:hypothetical protein n=1 Tax=Prosthecobacter sp. TaxID=1965333 RepID=UPI003BAFE4A7
MTTAHVTANTNATGSTTAPKEEAPVDPQAVKNPDCYFGGNIEVLAGHFGIQPADFALAISGILTNIAGPYAGLIAPTGNRIRPHLNILNTAAATPKVRAMEERLFPPLRLRLNWLRQRASSQSRKLLDRWVFGDHDPDKVSAPVGERHLWMKQHRHELDITQKEIFNGASMPPIQFNEYRLASGHLVAREDCEIERTSPGPAYLPSVCFEGITVSQLGGALKESLHRQPLLVHPVLGILQQAERRADADETVAAELVTYLRGRDCQFAPVHPDQGPGTFEHALVQLWADTSLDRVGEILQEPASSGNDLLKLCLLWEPARWKTPSTYLQYVPAAWNCYTHVVHKLLDLRCFARNKSQMRLMVPDENALLFCSQQEEFLDFLDRAEAVDKTFVSQFHDLPARLLWVFLQFRQKHENPWCLEAAFRTAKHAVRMQERLLKKARDIQANWSSRKSMQEVIKILSVKGPCNIRDMQRSKNKWRAAYFEPGLKMLQQQGRLQVDEQRRYVLVTPAS